MKKYLLLVLLGICILFGVFFFALQSNSMTQIQTVDGVLSVRLADNPLEQTKGLSGATVAELQSQGAEGMLFVFGKAEERTFWMKEMNFDLDVVWILNGKIVSISENVQAPKNGEEPVRMYSGPIGADMVLELPAGGVKDHGLLIGQPLTIAK
ncbi:MAG: DUF192 domain-containing protein [Patescibacteria group bacterium]